MNQLCSAYFGGPLIHFLLLPVVCPVVVFLLVRWLSRIKELARSFLLLLHGIGFILSAAICVEASFECQVRLFGEVSTDPGDIGLVLFTLPLLLVISTISAIAAYFAPSPRRRARSAEGAA